MRSIANNRGGVSVQLEKLNGVGEHEGDSIWIEANATWADLLTKSLQKSQSPYVIPYNCHLSVGGVLSAGGIGASSFRFGSVTSHVKALEVMTTDGKVDVVDSRSDLFRACLSGQGRFAVITKACINLRQCAKNVRTFFLVYLDKERWLQDIQEAKKEADYLETFCSPAVQGAKLTDAGRRLPFAHWLYALHISKEFDNKAPTLDDINPTLKPWKLLHTQDEAIESYLHRHDSRFEAMKTTGQWDLLHPWYECFISQQLLNTSLDEILPHLPLYYATVLQVVPIVNQSEAGFLMFPKGKQIYAVMILTPGVNCQLLPGCLQTIYFLDSLFLDQGGKRYLSGYLGENLEPQYWENHFGSSYDAWLNLKKKYDPRRILQSSLHPL
ncbi:FAD-binding protein [Legionella clemsonensis]|uniref:Putative oxidoreductase ORF5 in fasciation locus n=1 Tax=Legionella clemsonensis TaxID=1867846 RepID=A0A222P151_9GAMM|nr:FAD-binding protein [Legionella clemsonensis]ASQ45559.1 putative oxidoreductase ORF5 in fasciation locus [Legionella clemsonensis]